MGLLKLLNLLLCQLQEKIKLINLNRLLERKNSGVFLFFIFNGMCKMQSGHFLHNTPFTSSGNVLVPITGPRAPQATIIC